MTNALHIRHLHHRSHIRGVATPGIRARVDLALTKLLDDELDAAMVAAGIDLEEEVCIRRLHTRGKLGLGRSDAQLATDLSLVWVDALRRAIESGGTDVVRYRSRLHAMIDMGLRVASADGSRIWAWQQLGLWPQEFDVTSAHAFEHLVEALARNVTTVASTLVALARENRLTNFLRRAQRRHIEALAAAALEAVQLPPALVAGEIEDVGVPPIDSTPMIDAAVINAVRLSPIAANMATHALEKARTPAAILTLLAAEPALLRGPLPHIYIESAACALETFRHSASKRTAGDSNTDACADSSPDSSPDSRSDSNVASGVTHKNGAASTRPLEAANDRESGGKRTESEPQTGIDRSRENSKTPAVAKLLERSIESIDYGQKGNPDSSSPREPGETKVDIDDSQVVDRPVESLRAESSESPVMPTREFLSTEWGGLLFLLSLIEPSGVIERVTADQLLQVRGLRWVLHRLATTLVPISADDAVACAFAGIQPKELATLLSQSQPTDPELTLIRELADIIVSNLHGRLSEGETGDSNEARQRSLHTLCRRDARVSFEPGWIEVHFPLHVVSTSIRRSGLDRDPDWVPWLGAVVRFVYE